MEATYYMEHAPVCWVSTPSCIERHGPLMHLRLGAVSAIVVSTPELAKEVMKTHGVIFASRPTSLAVKIMTYDYTDIASAPYGNYWRQIGRAHV